jgi:hypothetical protein
MKYHFYQLNIKNFLIKLSEVIMTITALKPISSTAFVRSLSFSADFCAKKLLQLRAGNRLKGLPDHLLLDIGIDPRNVSGREPALSARPDLLYTQLTISTYRTAAKSN